VGLLSLEKRRLRGDLIDVYKYLQGEHKEDGARHFSAVPSDGTRGCGHKHKSFYLNIRKYVFAVRVTEHWHRSPREVESPSSEMFKSCLDAVLCNQLHGTRLESEGLDEMTSRVHSSLSQSVALSCRPVLHHSPAEKAWTSGSTASPVSLNDGVPCPVDELS